MKKPLQEKPRLKPRLAHSHPRDVAISTSSDMSAPDTKQPIFDPGMDVATVLFSHVRCVKTRVNLTLVSKLWREASKPAAAYPLEFDFDASWRIDVHRRVVVLLDNDVALSLPHERVVRLLGGVVGNYVSVHLCDEAAEVGSLRLLKWARVNNFAWRAETCLRAAAHGHLPALKYLHENGCPWNANTCSSAALNGHLPALKYLHETGCPWDSHTCSNAALNGHLPALKYLHENGCPWDSNTCSSAAHNGQLPALKYLHETGCPWNSHTCYCAAFSKQWDCLQYAVDNKCPGWEKYAKEYAEHLR